MALFLGVNFRMLTRAVDAAGSSTSTCERLHLSVIRSTNARWCSISFDVITEIFHNMCTIQVPQLMYQLTPGKMTSNFTQIHFLTTEISSDSSWHMNWIFSSVSASSCERQPPPSQQPVSQRQKLKHERWQAFSQRRGFWLSDIGCPIIFSATGSLAHNTCPTWVDYSIDPLTLSKMISNFTQIHFLIAELSRN